MCKSSPRKRLLFALCGILAGALIAFCYREYKTPLSGGGKPDNFFTNWAKNRAYSVIPVAEDRAVMRLTSDGAHGWHGIFAEPVQSLAAYQTQNPTRPTPTRRTLVLQPIGTLNTAENAILADCKLYCEAFFGLTTRIAPPLSINKSAFSPRVAAVGASKTQLNSGALLGFLKTNLPDDAAAYLGLTSDDLYTDGLSFVFGQATFHERVGIYSLARYFPKKPRPTPNEREQKIALRRTAQVLTHEAGHMFGITHCVLYKCSMNGSNSLADSDASPLDYCPVCTRKLAWNLGYDRAKRDAQLQGVRRRFGLN